MGSLLGRRIINLFIFILQNRMFTSRTEETPDPDRAADKDVIETRDAPVVFHENSDSDDEDDGNHGYEMITQEDDGEEQ